MLRELFGLASAEGVFSASLRQREWPSFGLDPAEDIKFGLTTVEGIFRPRIAEVLVGLASGCSSHGEELYCVCPLRSGLGLE